MKHAKVPLQEACSCRREDVPNRKFSGPVLASPALTPLTVHLQIWLSLQHSCSFQCCLITSVAGSGAVQLMQPARHCKPYL